MITDQAAVDAANRGFWDTLCGTSWAKMLGVTDFSLGSLVKFDSYYLGYYPYLLKHVRPDLLWGKRILEIGLGYGTLSQLLAAAGDYIGLDIADGPVAGCQSAAADDGVAGTSCCRGRYSSQPSELGSFDSVVTIGCLHHTGNLPLALERVRSLLKPGGRLIFMVYNAYSYRRWLLFTRPTLRSWLSDYLGIVQQTKASLEERAAYDGVTESAAPETELFSARQLRRLLRGFKDISIVRENGVPESLLHSWTREEVLARVSPYLGLDLYITAFKH